MGLSYCEGCGQLEGKTQEDEYGNIECAECHELITNVPEHDDFDMDR